jgi:thioredoxin 1
MSSVHDITDEQFAHEVLESETPVLVEFWAAWCGPCRQLGPVLEQLAEERAGSLKVVKINQDENPLVSADYRVMGLPTMLVFDGGEAVGQMLGARSKARLVDELDRALDATA